MSLKGADLTASLYIGHVSLDASIEDLKKYIEDQNISVIDLTETARKHNRFKSFRLCIKKSDLEPIRDPNFWPEGIVVRRFFHKVNTVGAAIPSNA